MPTAPRFRVESGAGRPAGAGVRLPVFLLLLGTLLSGIAVGAPAADQRSSSERNYELNRGAQQMLPAMLDQETGVRGYVLTADRRFLEPYRAGRADVAAAERSILAEAAGDGDLTDAIAESAQIAASWQQEAQETVDLVADRGGGGRNSAAALRRKAIMDRFRAANARVQAIVDARRRRALGRSETVPVASILLLAVAGIGIGWALVVRPRRRVAAEQLLARRYAAEQQEFTEALQMTGSEEEANELLERHVERSLPGSDALVLRRSNASRPRASSPPMPSGRRASTPSRAPAWRFATAAPPTRARAPRRSSPASCAGRATRSRRPAPSSPSCARSPRPSARPRPTRSPAWRTPAPCRTR